MNQNLTSDQLISFHRNKPDYKESPPNSLLLAYGDHKYVKFTYELLNQSDILKLKILEQLNEDFKLSNNITLALLSSDILSVILKHFENTNQQIRERSSRVMIQICTTNLGRQKIIQKKSIQHISKLIDDKVNSIRANCYNSLLKFSQDIEGKDHILQTRILEKLVDKLLQEKIPQILVKTLQLMNSLLKGENGIPKILKTESIKRLLNLIKDPNTQIRQYICLNLASISFNQIGKSQIIQKKGVILLCERTEDQVSQVRQAATLCLSSLAQLNDAKNQIIAWNFFDKIQKLLGDSNKFTKLNTVQLLGSLAEHPLGRNLGTTLIPILQNMKDVERIYIDGTIEVIKWKP